MLAAVSVVLCFLLHAVQAIGCAQDCRNIPGSPGFPNDAHWQALNVSVSGRLVRPIPSGEYCRQVSCSDTEWVSASWRNTNPGSLNQASWEQDYDARPPQLCGRTSPPTCSQGNVPIYAVLAENVRDVQAGVGFARKHNLRLSVKASGHDYFGRSTAKYSLLIHTHKLQSITFTEGFYVGFRNEGSAVTVGSGVGASTLYKAAQKAGKTIIAGTAATVVPAGGFVQVAGHSPLSPFLGLGADNVLEFKIVTADGILRTANELQNPDLFWALRGGGGGTWGVVISATFKTYPTFQATQSTVIISVANSTVMGGIAQSHAEHIFDWDHFNVGQYFYAIATGTGTEYDVALDTFFPHATVSQANAAMAPLLKEITLKGGFILSSKTVTADINTLLAIPDDEITDWFAMGSRLIPAETYRHNPHQVGDAYKQLADVKSAGILALVVAGGKVAENADIDSAVHPGWRKAKTHLVVFTEFNEDSTLEQVRTAQTEFQRTQAPILKSIEGPVPASYANEADPLEQDWKRIFYGPHYDRLSEIKRTYDPTDLFIVVAGVGSERWDSYGLCKRSSFRVVY